ncbi:hypothetical protein SNE40_023443 [Patella caerulea]|uniref:CUB domain-containing protein n=1 Tax=Patella caerulea TaxID=87958 RepID=A0AAN8GI12_PATCE
MFYMILLGIVLVLTGIRAQSCGVYIRNHNYDGDYCVTTILNSTEGTFQSPCYNETGRSYEDNNECNYMIQTGSGVKDILLYFEDFDTLTDLLVVDTDGKTNNKRDFTGDMTGAHFTIQSVKRYAMLRFVTDFNGVGRGFSIKYKIQNAGPYVPYVPPTTTTRKPSGHFLHHHVHPLFHVDRGFIKPQ